MSWNQAMSMAIGALSGSKTMALEETSENAEKGAALMGKDGEENTRDAERDSEAGGEDERFSRQMSELSLYATEEDDNDDGKGAKGIDLGPRLSLKSEIEKDKDDESLRRWKEQLLGSVDLNSVGGEDYGETIMQYKLQTATLLKLWRTIYNYKPSESTLPYFPQKSETFHVAENLEPEVKILSLSILSPGRPDIVLPIPAVPNSKGVWFTLKEGSHYKLKFIFSVSNNIVSGLRYTNTVWKTGVKVDRTKEMLGTFSPQLETYTYETPEETTPSGIFARGSYSARTKFIDDDGKCYLEINYTFDIRREWPSTS